MRCAICGKETGETELGKQYCYDCEKKWLDDDNETIDLSYCFNNYNLLVQRGRKKMVEHDSAEAAYKKGYAQAIKDVFEKIDSILNVDIVHSYMLDSFILSQSKYVQIKKSFLGESANSIGAQNKEANLPETKYKNINDFREKNCMMCGSQLCAGPNDEFAGGCNYLKAAVFEDESKPI